MPDDTTEARAALADAIERAVGEMPAWIDGTGAPRTTWVWDKDGDDEQEVVLTLDAFVENTYIGADWLELRRRAALAAADIALAYAATVRRETREECGRVFSEGVLCQAERLGIAPSQMETPGQWRDRVRQAAIRRLGSDGEVG